MKVNFIICGAQKSGTTALDSYLRQHTDICMAPRKEVHFFDREENFLDNTLDYSAYHSVFNLEPSHRLLGESTPIYMYWYDAPKRIWQYNSDIKLIVLLRNPIERAYSSWNMLLSEKRESLSFWEAIQTESERCREALPYQHRLYSYIDRGFYLEQLRRLWRFFPREQVLVLKSEELRENSTEIMQKVFDFLGVEALAKMNFENKHSTPYDSKMTKREKDYLIDIFEYEIKALERVLGWDCSDWLL